MKRTVALVATAILLAGCSTAPAPAPAVEHVTKQIGESAGLVTDSGQPKVEFVILAIRKDFTCSANPDLTSANGNFVAVEMEVATADTLAPDVFRTGRDTFAILGPDGVLETDLAGNAEGCLKDEEKMLEQVEPGQRVTGTVVLDSRNTSGRLIFSQESPGGRGWVWDFA